MTIKELIEVLMTQNQNAIVVLPDGVYYSPITENEVCEVFLNKDLCESQDEDVDAYIAIGINQFS